MELAKDKARAGHGGSNKKLGMGPMLEAAKTAAVRSKGCSNPRTTVSLEEVQQDWATPMLAVWRHQPS
jgi:hypothetical protein